jgi:hypothetical protein
MGKIFQRCYVNKEKLPYILKQVSHCSHHILLTSDQVIMRNILFVKSISIKFIIFWTISVSENASLTHLVSNMI